VLQCVTLADHLLTLQNAALLLIDYQPSQLAGVRSMDQALLVKNAVSTVRSVKTFEVPVVHSTINVATGRGKPTLPELAGLLRPVGSRSAGSPSRSNCGATGPARRRYRRFTSSSSLIAC
jgi:nicotinamidase-related amidase